MQGITHVYILHKHTHTHSIIFTGTEVQTFKLPAAAALVILSGVFLISFLCVFLCYSIRIFVLFVPNGVDFNLKISVELFKEQSVQTI